MVSALTRSEGVELDPGPDRSADLPQREPFHDRDRTVVVDLRPGQGQAVAPG
jgi:hypothetical protein